MAFSEEADQTGTSSVKERQFWGSQDLWANSRIHGWNSCCCPWGIQVRKLSVPDCLRRHSGWGRCSTTNPGTKADPSLHICNRSFCVRNTPNFLVNPGCSQPELVTFHLFSRTFPMWSGLLDLNKSSGSGESSVWCALIHNAISSAPTKTDVIMTASEQGVPMVWLKGLCCHWGNYRCSKWGGKIKEREKKCIKYHSSWP